MIPASRCYSFFINILLDFYGRPTAESRIKDPHDTFFGTVFSIPSCAYSFVRDQLPDKIVELLADKEPRIIESSFFGDDLSKSKADLLMEVEMASGESGFIYVLVEHKSYQDGVHRFRCWATWFVFGKNTLGTERTWKGGPRGSGLCLRLFLFLAIPGSSLGRGHEILRI